MNKQLLQDIEAFVILVLTFGGLLFAEYLIGNTTFSIGY